MRLEHKGDGWRYYWRQIANWNADLHTPNSLLTCAAAAAIGCLDHHLERRHALEITKAFVKNAHGDISGPAREAFKEVYNDFAEWSRSE